MGELSKYQIRSYTKQKSKNEWSNRQQVCLMLIPYLIFEVKLSLGKWQNRRNVQPVYIAVQKVVRRQ